MSQELVPAVLTELTVVKQENAREERVFAHSQMRDVTRRPPVRYCNTETLSDLIAWLKTYGDPKLSSVYFSSACSRRSSGAGPFVRVFLNEEWRENDNGGGFGKFELTPAKALTRWLGTCENGEQSQLRLFEQEGLVKFLEAWGDKDVRTPASAALLNFRKTLRDLSLAVSITYNKRLEDENNLRLEFKVEEKQTASSAAQIPKQWLLFLPVFEGGPLYEIPARLAYRIPVKENETAATRFWFEAPTLPAIFEQAVEDVRSMLKADLGPEWQVFRGFAGCKGAENETEKPF